MRHFKSFVEQNRDFDQRLGTILNLAFHDLKNLNSAFKVKYTKYCVKKVTSQFSPCLIGHFWFQDFLMLFSSLKFT